MDLLLIIGVIALFMVIAFGAGLIIKHEAKREAAERKRRQQARVAYFGSKPRRQVSKVPSTDHSQSTEGTQGATQAQLMASDRTSGQEQDVPWEAQYGAQERERLASERVLIEPQLVMLEDFRSRPMAEIPIRDVRFLITDESTDVDFLEHLSDEQSDWLYGAYEQLVPAELERLVQGAIDGSVEDYHQALTLKTEAADLVGYDIEQTTDLVNKWDRMIVRHVPHPEWDDLAGWNEYYNDSLELYENAIAGDFFSICIVLLLMEKGNEDADIVDRLLDDFRAKMEETREAYRASFLNSQGAV